MIESVPYLCLSNQPVYEWLWLSDDLWGAAAIDMERKVWESIWWLGDDWLFERISEYMDDETWANMVASTTYHGLCQAIRKMIEAHNPWDTSDR